MGLDTTHGCWHGGYSSFNIWRNKLAEVAGYELAYVGSGRPYDSGREMPLVDYGHLPVCTLYGEWDECPADPLMILIAHSDCDGKIDRKHTKLLANRLKELLPLLPDEIGTNHIGYWKDKTQTFIKGLMLAHKNRAHVRFH